MDLPTDPLTRGERDALMAILQHPEHVGRELLERVTQVKVGNAALGVVRDAVAAALAEVQGDPDSEDRWVASVAEQAPAGFTSLVSQLAIAPIPQRPDQIGAYCRDVVTSLIDRDLLRLKAEVLGAMQRAQSDGDQERWSILARESAALETERRRLRES